MALGCGVKTAEIARLSQSRNPGVFTEVGGGQALPEGYAELLISATIKTHVEGYYVRL